MAKGRKFYRRTVNLMESVITDANGGGWLRSLACFITMKALFKNNCVYNFNVRKLSQLTGYSTGCLSFHLQELQKRGLIRRHGKNLSFLGINKIAALYGSKKRVAVRVASEHKNQFDELRGQILVSNLIQQSWNIKKRRKGQELKLKINGKPIRKSEIGYSSKLDNHKLSNYNYVGMSVFGVAKLFGRSHATGARLRKKFEKLGIIKNQKVFEIFSPKFSAFSLLYLKRVFNLWNLTENGNVYVRRRMNAIQICSANTLNERVQYSYEHKMNKRA